MATDISKLNRRQLAALKKRIEVQEKAVLSKSISALRTKITNMIHEEGFTLGEVSPTKTRRSSALKGRAVAPKYRNPSDPSKTWSGRGRMPGWYKDATKKGKKEKDLLI